MAAQGHLGPDAPAPHQSFVSQLTHMAGGPLRMPPQQPWEPPGAPGIPGIPGRPGTATRTPGSTISSNYNDYKYKDIYDNLQNDLNAISQYNENQYSDSQNNDQDNIINNSQRIYDPIDYKQHYREDMRYRPNVCSYGTKQIVQPIFLNSSTLFQGTDLKEAAENTQVGSIMPKFEYREYEDAK